jgi:hypothetical protein
MSEGENISEELDEELLELLDSLDKLELDEELLDSLSDRLEDEDSIQVPPTMKSFSISQ